MRRREFIVGLSASSASIPFVSFAQQPRKFAIGCLGQGSLKDVRINFGNVRRGLTETGFVEGRDYEVEYRAADYQPNTLHGLAAELLARDVAVIVTLASPALPAAQAVTKSVPIVFLTGFDPVANGFVEGLNRPGTNLTGVFILTGPLAPKRLELLRELAPAARSIAVLLSSTSLRFAKVKDDLEAAAKSLGVELVIQQADVPAEFEAAFDAIRRTGCGALMVGGDAVFTNNRAAVVNLVARHKIPAIYAERDYAVAGGLASYGPDFGEAYRLLGTYAGRILKGEKPADLPVQQVTKVELVLNARTARELNITFPMPLLGRADEVIE
jgi:putative tryptophan/tyrosine transport system substrate-binding protein